LVVPSGSHWVRAWGSSTRTSVFFHRFQLLGDKMDWVVTFGHQPTWRLAASVACGLGECRARQVTWRHMIASVLLLTKSPMCVSAKPRMAGGAWITCSYGGYAVGRQATESQRAWCVYAPLGHTFGPPCWGRGHTRSRAAQSIGPLLQLWSYTRSVIDLRASPKAIFYVQARANRHICSELGVQFSTNLRKSP